MTDKGVSKEMAKRDEYKEYGNGLERQGMRGTKERNKKTRKEYTMILNKHRIERMRRDPERRKQETRKMLRKRRERRKGNSPGKRIY